MYESNKQLLKNKLELVQNAGVALFLEGEPSSPEEIIGVCLLEESVYMADYVLDEQGILMELRYDKVSSWN